MSFVTGDDGTDKNDGYITFGTESAASNGNVNATERLRIDRLGKITHSASGGDNQYISKRTSATDSNGNYFFQLFAKNNSDTTVGGIGIHRDTANDDSRMVFSTRNSGGSNQERLRIASDGQATFDKGAPGSSNQVISRFQAESSRRLDIVWHDSGSLMGFNTPGNHSYIFKCNDSEKLRITSTGEVKQYGFTGSADTAVDDLVIGNTDSGTNRGMTIWSHSNQNGGIAFADNDSNFRGAIQYLHAQDRLRFIAEGEEVGMWSNQRGLMVGPTSTGDSVTSKGGAKLYHLCGATPLNGSYNSSTETPLMRCGHSFNGIFQMWMLFNGDEYHKGCRQETIMCQGTYGYVSNSVRREHNQNALGAGLNSMDFGYQNSGSPNYYFKVTATWASGQNQPYILWSWTGHNSEYPYAL